MLQAHSYDEVEAFQQVATGLVVNVGTLSPDWVASMQLSAKTANSLNKPWVLDPVGAGATEFRTKASYMPVSLLHQFAAQSINFKVTLEHCMIPADHCLIAEVEANLDTWQCIRDYGCGWSSRCSHARC